MSVPAVTADDLALYLGTTVDFDRATYLIRLAQAQCEAVISPLPDGADSVVLDMVGRAYVNVENVQQESAGSYGVTYAPVAGGMFLTRENKRTLRRLSGGGGAFTVDLLPDDVTEDLPWWDTTAGWPF